MRKIHGLALCGIIALFLSGCGKPASNGNPAAKSPAAKSTADENAAPSVKLTGPAKAVFDFLEAVRTGNDEVASGMLSKMAREKTAALNRAVTPPASDTARFTIGKVEYVGEDGARVESSWTDLDEEGEPRTDDALWVVRREEDGWRVAGVAVLVFPGEPLLLLNFEDPEEMFRKQEWVREEFRRRASGLGSEEQPQMGEKSKNPGDAVTR